MQELDSFLQGPYTALGRCPANPVSLGVGGTLGK